MVVRGQYLLYRYSSLATEGYGKLYQTMRDTMDKAAISLASVFIGWLLSQGTVLSKRWWEARKMRVGLLTELDDIRDQLRRVVLIHHRQLQIFVLKGMDPSAALPIHNMYFKQYFKEAFSYLNRSQRLSYQLIHSSLDNLNKMEEGLAKFSEESYNEIKSTRDDEGKLRIVELWGDRVMVLYKTARDVLWHIDYHLSNSKCPAIDLMGPMHVSYVKFQHELDEEVARILDGARALKIEDFDKPFDANMFANESQGPA